MAPGPLCSLIFSSFLFLFIYRLNAETVITQNPCASKTTCSECIQTPSCAWCSLNNATAFKHYSRCFQLAGQHDGPRCPDEDLYFPSNKYVIISGKGLQNGKAAGGGSGIGGGGFGAASGAAAGSASGSASASGSFEGSYSESSDSEIVQISPQRVKLQLRAGESLPIILRYAQAEDYPVDLYYLMDLSKSMEDDKDKLSTLGDLLSSTMRNMTSNFQLGFGSFVDKVVMPYVSTVPSKLKMPCTNCTAPYGYKNHLNLSKDTTKFSTMVRDARVSGNLDAPEGGFDAIMQAVVCKNQIGWRDKARRLLVFSTDAGFHYAGDGKLGGIIRPNDGHCHLESGSYSYSKIQDYPSISQLNLKVKQNAINVIFAVTKDQISVYDKLRGYIEGSSSGTLSADSSNVVELVKKQYEAISSKVELKGNATNGVEIKYYTKCLNRSGSENNTNICEHFKVGQEIEFKLDVFLRECPKDPKLWKQIIEVYPVAVSESLIIELEMLCSCPCEHPGNPGYIPNAKECSFAGTYKCGVCECDEFHFGRNCECAPGSYQEVNQTKGCRPSDQPDAAECSGRGQCVCNQCECNIRDNINEQITGTYCDCDNFSCYRSGAEICGGSEHGTCECGVCKCKYPWIGNACDCYNLTDKCYSTFDKSEAQLECNGHGKCVCGACVCETLPDGGKYSGRFCERCPNCTETCDELKPCVLCQIYKIGPYSKEECVQKCRNFTPKEVAVVQANEQESEFACAGYDEEDCRFVFVYKKVNSTHYEISAQKDRECPPKVFLLGIVLGVIAAVVLMGLAILLLWKLLTTIHDRREFAKFEKERMMAKWDTGENPIYKQATSTFKNPTYAGKG